MELVKQQAAAMSKQAEELEQAKQTIESLKAAAEERSKTETDDESMFLFCFFHSKNALNLN